MKLPNLPHSDSKILQLRQIEQFSDEQILVRIRERAIQARSAFIEIGKLLFVLKKRHGDSFQPYVQLANKYGPSLSNASYGAKVWEHYVDTGVLTEPDFERLTFKQCLELDRERRKGADPNSAVTTALRFSKRGNDSSSRGQRFEKYVLQLLKAKYASIAWTAPGALKRQERGLDFIGTFHHPEHGLVRRLGAQVKFHAVTNAPDELEWLRFLAGCYVQGITEALFITTGKLSADQLRDAGEARIHIIQGRDEITKQALLYGLPACPEV